MRKGAIGILGRGKTMSGVRRGDYGDLSCPYRAIETCFGVVSYPGLQPGLSHFALTGQPDGGQTGSLYYRLPLSDGL